MTNSNSLSDYAKIEAVLRELLRLYDWRNELGRIERDFNHDRKQMKTWLNQYGREKKAAWAEAREVLNATPQESAIPRLEVAAATLGQIERQSSGPAPAAAACGCQWCEQMRAAGNPWSEVIP